MVLGAKPMTGPSVGLGRGLFATCRILQCLSSAVVVRAQMQTVTAFVMQTTGYAIETAANSSVEWLSPSVGAVKSQWSLMDVMTAVPTGRTAEPWPHVGTMMIVLQARIVWPVNAPLAFVLLSFSPSAAKMAIHMAMYVSLRAKVVVVADGPCAGEPQACGGILGELCPMGEVCVDDPEDDCEPRRGGADCPGICQPDVACNNDGPVCALFCEHGFAVDENGCTLCQCNPAPDDLCADWYYQPCQNNAACEPGYQCGEVIDGCVAGNCMCDPATGEAGRLHPRLLTWIWPLRALPTRWM